MAGLTLLEVLEGPVLEVAPTLLGSHLSHESPEGTVKVELTEVEAYAGLRDPASHAYRGQTPRNAIMFGPAGRMYVYLSYGVHVACNVVTGPPGEASAVLLRSGRVLEGEKLAQSRRGSSVRPTALATGPGCLSRALGVTLGDYGVDLLGGGRLTLSEGRSIDPTATRNGPRVGVTLAHHASWRFWVDGDVTVSTYRRSPRAVG